MFPLLHPRLAAKAIALALALSSPLACNTTYGPAAERAAANAARVGLTLGALPRDSSGAGADSMKSPESGRTGTTVDADAEAPASEPMATPDWAHLADLVGNWRCSIWGLDGDGKRIAADATWTGVQINAGMVQLRLNSFDARGFDDAFGAEFNGYTQLSYTPDTGYELLTAIASTSPSQRWVGELKAGEERYRFYSSHSGRQIELRFVGQDVFLLNTYTSGDRGEVQIQSYRFARTP